MPIVQEAGWAPGPVWTGAENLAPTGIRSPDRPVRSQSLYRLRYPAHDGTSMFRKKFDWVTLRYEELRDTSSVANVVRAVESKVMKSVGNKADSKKSQAKQFLLRSGQALRVPGG